MMTKASTIPSVYRELTRAERAIHAGNLLRDIASFVKPSEFPGLAAKVRSAIKSADGAANNARRFEARELRGG